MDTVFVGPTQYIVRRDSDGVDRGSIVDILDIVDKADIVDTHMDTVLVRPTQHIVRRNSDGVNRAARCFQITYTLKAVQIPHLHIQNTLGIISHFRNRTQVFEYIWIICPWLKSLSPLFQK